MRRPQEDRKSTDWQPVAQMHHATTLVSALTGSSDLQVESANGTLSSSAGGAEHNELVSVSLDLQARETNTEPTTQLSRRCATCFGQSLWTESS